MQIALYSRCIFLLTLSCSALIPTLSCRGAKKIPSPQDQSTLLVVLLMVKNEKDVIIPTLQTLVTKDSSPDIAYVIYDTGSTDGTQSLARDFFQREGIKKFRIVDEAFIDFATSRNRALRYARKSYPSSTFILFPDAEWYLNNFDELINFCRQKRDAYAQGTAAPYYYRLEMGRSEYKSLTPRLFHTHDRTEFEGVVHECPTTYSGENVPNTIYFTIGSSKCGAEKSQQRWYRDRELLLKEFEKDPTNPRTALYLGLTESWIDDLENAYSHLKKRASLASFVEEDYWALYNLAEVTEKLTHKEPTNYSWREAQEYYLQAFTLRPHRAEPLVKIAEHYAHLGQYAISYLYARRAAELPVPSIEKEVLPVLTHVYSFGRWELLGRVAWYVGAYDIGEQAVKMAIEADPNATYLYNTLSYYWERK